LQLSSDYYVLHHAYPTLEKYVSKTLGRYARLEAEGVHRAGQHFRARRLLWEPVRTFLACFVRRAGYRDGWRGFILAVLYAGYRFMIWANLWLLDEQARSSPTRSEP
jgi:(heptosyl)LPS beta-1,4-glucosyltransferase